MALSSNYITDTILFRYLLRSWTSAKKKTCRESPPANRVESLGRPLSPCLIPSRHPTNACSRHDVLRYVCVRYDRCRICSSSQTPCFINLDFQRRNISLCNEKCGNLFVRCSAAAFSFPVATGFRLWNRRNSFLGSGAARFCPKGAYGLGMAIVRPQNVRGGAK